MKAQGIVACNFYWFDNNWHYICKWDHLKNATALYPLFDVQCEGLHRLTTQDFSASDAVMGRCVSTLISLLLDGRTGEGKRREDGGHQKGVVSTKCKCVIENFLCDLLAGKKQNLKNTNILFKRK